MGENVCSSCGAVIASGKMALHDKFHRMIALIDGDVRNAHAEAKND